MSKGIYVALAGIAAVMVGAMVTTDHPKATSRTAESQAESDPAMAKCMTQYGAYIVWPGKTRRALTDICQSIRTMTAAETARYDYIFVGGTLRCLDAKGFGEWTGSSGVSLQGFCARAGSMLTLNQLKIDHPEIF